MASLLTRTALSVKLVYEYIKSKGVELSHVQRTESMSDDGKLEAEDERKTLGYRSNIRRVTMILETRVKKNLSRSRSR